VRSGSILIALHYSPAIQPIALLRPTAVDPALRRLKRLSAHLFSPISLCHDRARVARSPAALGPRHHFPPVVVARRRHRLRFLSLSICPRPCPISHPVRLLPSYCLQPLTHGSRALTPLMAIPGMISLGGGLPNPSTFPFQVRTETLYIPPSGAWRVFGAFRMRLPSHIASCPGRASPSHWPTAARCLWMARR
jgi:hypothetical protein